MNARLAAQSKKQSKSYADTKYSAYETEEAKRKRLSPVALHAVKKIYEAWELSQEGQAVFLGGVSVSTLNRMFKDIENSQLTQDQMTRASALIGIYENLHIIFRDEMSDRWIGLHNSDPLFQGVSPLSFMLTEGIPAMLKTRSYIEAWRNGL